MARVKIYLFVFLSVCLAVLGQSEPSAPETILVEGKHNTTSSSSTTTTTPAPTTTTAAPTTTTAAPTTTTAAPTTTTTPAPTTTTTPAPTTTTTPAPTPPPAPELGTWSFTNTTTNVTCIVLQFAASLNVTYNTKTLDNGTALQHARLAVPAAAAVAAGACGRAAQWLRLEWAARGAEGRHALTLHWVAADRDYHLSAVNASLLRDDHFPNATWTSLELSHGGAEWSAPARGSYRCAAAALNLTEIDGAVAELALSRLQEEAFRTDQGHQFSAAVECGAGGVPDAVPIAVGCALGALVVLVLGAYLIGRRRAQQPGYVSM